MNPSTYKEIKKAASELPKFQRKNVDGTLMFSIQTETILGKDLPKEYKKKNDWVPMKNYTRTIKVPVLINHEVNMVKIYKNKGIDGVNEYIDSINEVVKQLPPPPQKQSFIKALFKLIWIKIKLC